MSSSSRQNPRISLLRVFIPFALGYFLSYLFRVVNAVIAPNLTQDLSLDPARLGLLTAAYFLTFAAFQLPLGVLLDRFGPRRVEAVLLVFAAVGALVFARAESLAGLVAGRALIGFGVSACLMAAFKSFVIWFPASRLPLVNGLQMAAGGMGAIAATAPVEALLQVIDWRGVFVLLGLLTLLVAMSIFAVVPERQTAGAGADLNLQVRGIATVFRNPFFWQIAPWTVASQATFLSVQGLWAGPWLRDVAGFERSLVAQVLLLVAMAMVAGFFLFGIAAERLARRGVAPMAVAASGMLAFMLVQLMLVCNWAPLPRLLWVLFGFFGTASILPYAVLSQNVQAELTGRANTGLNLLVFVAAFAAQWGVGEIISWWPADIPGRYAPTGFQASFGLLLTLQALACLWFVVASRRCTVDGKQTD